MQTGAFPAWQTCVLAPGREEPLCNSKQKTLLPLQTLLGGWPNRMQVEVDPDIGVSAKTVGELRKVTAWPENLAITTPPEGGPDGRLKVSKASVATRVSRRPKMELYPTRPSPRVSPGLRRLCLHRRGPTDLAARGWHFACSTPLSRCLPAWA